MIYGFNASWSKWDGVTFKRFFGFSEDLNELGRIFKDSFDPILKLAQQIEDEKDPYGESHDVDAPGYLEYIRGTNLPYKKIVELREKVKRGLKLSEQDIRDADYTNLGNFWVNVELKPLENVDELRDYVDTWCYIMGEDVADRLAKCTKDTEMGDILYEVQDKFNGVK